MKKKERKLIKSILKTFDVNVEDKETYAAIDIKLKNGDPFFRISVNKNIYENLVIGDVTFPFDQKSN